MKKKFDVRKDARQLMEMAIEEMRKSVNEPRDDGKAAPKVGALLVNPDGTVETAHRGELRHGDHAEFTLLERKNRDNKLDGSILFATLEPCAPGSRNHPKMGCAERIGLSRIQEVWIGIEDPDPTVAGKGIKHLQDSGIEIHIFDRDLQEVIQRENKDFIAQALERAEAAREQPDEIVLSNLEKPGRAEMQDLSQEALDFYLTSPGMGGKADAEVFHRRLAQQGLLSVTRKTLKPTGYGVLLFGKTPRDTMPQTGLLGTIHFDDGREEVRNFEGPQVLVPELAIQWLHDKLPNPIDRSHARRREVNKPLFEIVREGVVNALVHRDYGIKGARCQLVATPDKIEIWSPGAPIEPITLEQLQSFSAPMLSRNPVLHQVFARMELAEERGLGLKSMRDKARQAGLPVPGYAWNRIYVVFTMYRNLDSSVEGVLSGKSTLLNPEERKGYAAFRNAGRTTRKEYAQLMGIDLKKAQRQLVRFVDLGLARREGSGRSTSYVVIEP